MLVKRVNTLHSLFIPDFDGSIGRARDKVKVVGREGHGKHP